MSPNQMALLCPECRHSNVPGATSCAICGVPFGPESTGDQVRAPNPQEAAKRMPADDATLPSISPEALAALEGGGTPPDDRTMISGTGSDRWSAAASGDGGAATGTLEPGAVVAGRYEIIRLLGEGGMGAVYQARDRELDRTLALKVIRPELARQPQVLERFKQELILARQVTHRNVIRIYDLGSDGGFKFITMEFFPGRDLSALMAEGRLPVELSVKIMRQVCSALEVAHGEGVIHRDLKPQNIMVGEMDRACVMDFGLARSVELSGLTQVGMLMGTPTYMSPEQAKGSPADHRSDIFALGIIFYEMLAGQVPFQAETVFGTLLKRTQEPAKPPIEIDPTIPEALNNIVLKALALDVEQRYQSVTEMLADINAWAEGRPGLTIVVPSFGPVLTPPPAPAAPSRRQVWQWAIGGAGLVAVAGGGYLAWERGRWTASSTHKPVLVLLTDFANNTGDPVFNSTLEQMFTTALEGASFINAYNRGEARRVALQLQSGATKLDGTMARLVAKREAIHYVIDGSVDALSRGYKLTIGVVEANNGKSIFSQSLEIPNKESVSSAVSKLAAQSRRALGDDTDESLQIAAAETYTAANLESANSFAQGQELLWAGKWDDAAGKYLKAIDFDPNFGRAYASLAAVNANKGDRQTAEKYYKQAMEKIDRMSDREKYRSRGVYYLMIRNHSKAIEEFTALLKQYPGDTAGLSNVAMAYHLKRDMKEAVKQSQKAIDLYPSYLLPRHNLAVYARYAGDFTTAEREERRVLQVNPSYLMALAGVALSQLARGATAEAADTYRSMEKISPRGASYCAMGLADIALYEGRLKDASDILEKGVAADLENKNQGAAAKKLVTLASTYAAQKQAGRAVDSVLRGLDAGKSEMVRLTGALVLAGLGQDAKAREIAAEFASKLEPDPQSYAKLIEGEIELKRGKAAQAVKLFSDAQQISDTWLARYGRGRTYLEAGAFTEAYSDLDLCVKRHGETTEVFLDDVATYHIMPPAYYYLGRAQDGLSSGAAVESYKKYIAIREKGDGDPLVADARRRIQKRA